MTVIFAVPDHANRSVLPADDCVTVYTLHACSPDLGHEYHQP